MVRVSAKGLWGVYNYIKQAKTQINELKNTLENIEGTISEFERTIRLERGLQTGQIQAPITNQPRLRPGCR